MFLTSRVRHQAESLDGHELHPRIIHVAPITQTQEQLRALYRRYRSCKKQCASVEFNQAHVVIIIFILPLTIMSQITSLLGTQLGAKNISVPRYGISDV